MRCVGVCASADESTLHARKECHLAHDICDAIVFSEAAGEVVGSCPGWSKCMRSWKQRAGSFW